ncbi:hypothetical protein [Hymenobacter sp. BT491]|uniref:hypothetical protein n=1 Tax=Hymenobacter sp. BT491 TaxID=2766779 RepID=UPI001CA40477|nr:hypothetical protein [Hymenobacter sp. BT491]
MQRKQPDVVQQFGEYLQNSTAEFADIQPVKDAEAKLHNLLNDSQKAKAFRVIGQAGTGSLIAFWKDNKATDFKRAPVVWLSSEGFPNSVFASSFEEYLSLLPYGTGFIYDVLSNYYFHKQSPQLQPAPQEKFTAAKIKSYLKQNISQYKGHAEFLTWLKDEATVTVASAPLDVIEKAIQHHPDLAAWLKH